MHPCDKKNQGRCKEIVIVTKYNDADYKISQAYKTYKLISKEKVHDYYHRG